MANENRKIKIFLTYCFFIFFHVDRCLSWPFLCCLWQETLFGSVPVLSALPSKAGGSWRFGQLGNGCSVVKVHSMLLTSLTVYLKTSINIENWAVLQFWKGNTKIPCVFARQAVDYIQKTTVKGAVQHGGASSVFPRETW